MTIYSDQQLRIEAATLWKECKKRWTKKRATRFPGYVIKITENGIVTLTVAGQVEGEAETLTFSMVI